MRANLDVYFFLLLFLLDLTFFCLPWLTSFTTSIVSLRFIIVLLNLVEFIVTASGFAIMQVPESALATVTHSLVMSSSALLGSPLWKMERHYHDQEASTI